VSPFATVSASAPLCLDHVVVPVRDAREARVFYRDRLGLPLVAALSGNDWGGHRWLMMVFGLGTGGQHLVAAAFEGVDIPRVDAYPRDARHHAFAVGSVTDWQRWRARLSEAHADFWEEDHGAQRSLYVVDPSGNVLEITTPSSAPFGLEREPPDEVVDRWIDGISRRPA
jgi:catechol 2,3-dioxygenase-like lactoylglutathione lyase family enzyme